VSKYADSLEAGLLANANCGGENVHRGCLIGALLGAYHGESAIPEHLKHGLYESRALAKEIGSFKATIIRGAL